MPQYRKRPVVVEAFRLDNYDTDHTVSLPPQWFTAELVKQRISMQPNGSAVIKTLEGVMTAEIGDWIIQGVKGEIYPCKNDIFRQTYEAVPEVPQKTT